MASIAGACVVSGPVGTVQTRRASATTGRSLDGEPSSRCFLADPRASARTLWQSAVGRCDTCRLAATSSERSGGVTFSSAAAAAVSRSPTATFSLSSSPRLFSDSNGGDYDDDDDRVHGRRLYKKETEFLSARISTRGGRRAGSGRRKVGRGSASGGGGGDGARGGVTRAAAAAAAAAAGGEGRAIKPLAETEAVDVLGEGGKLSDKIPAAPGVYAIYDKTGALQYVGLSRKVSFSLANHAARLPDLVATAKFVTVAGPDREALQAGWKAWVEEHVSTGGAVPPGNMQGNDTWKESSRRPPKADLKLTPGAHVPLSVPMETLISAVIKETPVVAFIKGTRTSPQCGFSHRVLMTLNKEGVDYETVNVLDEEFNPGVRDAIKAHSKWPTIPQVFVNGELVGGADLLEESVEKGEFKQLLAAIKK